MSLNYDSTSKIAGRYDQRRDSMELLLCTDVTPSTISEGCMNPIPVRILSVENSDMIPTFKRHGS